MPPKLITRLKEERASLGIILLAGLLAAILGVTTWATHRTNLRREVAEGLNSTQRLEPALCVTRLDNKWLAYLLYKPVPFDRHRKYPLLIGRIKIKGDTTNAPAWTSALARAGSYVVVADPMSWFGGPDKLPLVIKGVLDELVPDPTIDSSRLFLFSAGGEKPSATGLPGMFPVATPDGIESTKALAHLVLGD